MQGFSRTFPLALAGLLAAVAFVPPFAGAGEKDPAKRCDGEKATIVRGENDNFIKGTDGDDVIIAGSGVDEIKARGGDDRICAGRGNDLVEAGGGDDRIIGGRGRDRLFGNNSNDDIFGGRDRDRLFGGPGLDDLKGGTANDYCDGDDPDTTDDGAPDFADCEDAVDVD